MNDSTVLSLVLVTATLWACLHWTGNRKKEMKVLVYRYETMRYHLDIFRFRWHLYFLRGFFSFFGDCDIETWWNLAAWSKWPKTTRQKFYESWLGVVKRERHKSPSMVTHTSFSIPRSVHLNLTLIFFIPSPGSPKHPTTYLMLRHNWEISIPFSTPPPTNSFPNYRCISKQASLYF